MIPNNSDKFILWLFNERCLICFRHSVVIHEIDPRSSGPDAMNWSNRVVICDYCHKDVHNTGTGEDAVETLKERRIEFLEMIGRSSYA